MRVIIRAVTRAAEQSNFIPLRLSVSDYNLVVLSE